MSEPLRLPERMDLSIAIQLVSDLRAMKGDIVLDGSDVRQLGALCFQAMIAAARKARANGHRFEIRNATERMESQMKTMGLSPEQLMEGV